MPKLQSHIRENPDKNRVGIKCSIRNGFLLDINDFLFDIKWIYARYKINICLLWND